MKQRPILFNGAMVRAVLGGSKTQTRRMMKHQPPFDEQLLTRLFHTTVIDRNGYYQPGKEVFGAYTTDGEWTSTCPYGEVGDQLWVRETWRTDDSLNDKSPSMFSNWPVKYEADGKELAHGAFFGNTNGKTRVSIHMPRWASRITLEITKIRAERLQDITEENARAEGASGGYGAIPNYQHSATPLEHFKHIWEATGGDWGGNPWVWVIEFKRVQK